MPPSALAPTPGDSSSSSTTDMSTSLRRVRSTGDIHGTEHRGPRRPGPMRSSHRVRYSEVHSAGSNMVSFSSAADGSAPFLTVPASMARSNPAGPNVTWVQPPSVANNNIPQVPNPGRTPETTARMVPAFTPSRTSRILAFLGYGRGASRARRSLVILLWNLSMGLAQVCGILLCIDWF